MFSHYSDVIMSTMASQSPASRLFSQPFIRAQIKETSKLRVTGLCEGNSPVTGEFPAQRASNAKNIFIWWRHHEKISKRRRLTNIPASTGHPDGCRCPGVKCAKSEIHWLVSFILGEFISQTAVYVGPTLAQRCYWTNVSPTYIAVWAPRGT